MKELLYYFFNLEVIGRYLPQLLQGLLVTIEMAVLIIIAGLLLGLLLAVIRSYQIKAINFFIIFFVDSFRAIPQLVLVVLTYFALPYIGVTFSPFFATVIALFSAGRLFRRDILGQHHCDYQGAVGSGAFDWFNL